MRSSRRVVGHTLIMGPRPTAQTLIRSCRNALKIVTDKKKKNRLPERYFNFMEKIHAVFM